MTDSAGTPAEGRPEEPDGALSGSPGSAPGEPGTGAPAPRPTLDGNIPPRPPPHRRRWVRWTAAGTVVALLAAGGAAWALFEKLDGNITKDTAAVEELRRHEKERPLPLVQDALNILLIGSDTRSGRGNAKYGEDKGTQRSDTTILLHLAANRKSATAMSIPRDLMVDIPTCRKADGSASEEQFAQFNSAFEFGGTACTIRTVEKLTDIRVDHHMVVDFQGFKKMVDAVDGVQVCLKKPIDDSDAKLRLPAGTHTLDGEQALGYVRARKTLGNGSDTDRMDRQQQFLGALVKKVQSNKVLLNPTKLYPLLDAATSSLTTDPAIAGLLDLYDLVRSMRNVPTTNVRFLTVPREAYADNANRDQLVEPEASRLFTLLRKDAPVLVSPQLPQESRQDASGSWSNDGAQDWTDDFAGGYDESALAGFSVAYGVPGTGRTGAVGPPSAQPGPRASDGPSEPSPTPTFRGNTAAEGGCE